LNFFKFQKSSKKLISKENNKLKLQPEEINAMTEDEMKVLTNK
jgi:hypothetical protein